MNLALSAWFILMATWPTPKHQFFILSEAKIANLDVVIAGIEPANAWSDIPKGESQVAEGLLARGKQWRIKHRSERYPHVPRTFFERLEDSKNSTSKASVIIFKKNNPEQIIATLEFVWRKDASDRLPSEQDFNLAYDSENGPVIEIISLEANAEENAHLSHIVFKIMSDAGIVTQRYPTAIGPTVVWLQANRYVLTCFDFFKDYYARVGFHFSAEQPTADHVISMQMTAKNFENILIPRLTRRSFDLVVPTASGINTLQFDELAHGWHLPFIHEPCGENIGLVGKRIREQMPYADVKVRAIVRQAPVPPGYSALLSLLK